MPIDDFKKWWYEVGSGLKLLPGHDHEQHAARIAELAWLECYKTEHLKKSN